MDHGDAAPRGRSRVEVVETRAGARDDCDPWTACDQRLGDLPAAARDDPVVERGRLDEDHEVLAERAQVGGTVRDRFQHLRGKEVRPVALETFTRRLRSELVRADVVDHPDRAVAVEPIRLRRHEVECDVR